MYIYIYIYIFHDVAIAVTGLSLKHTCKSSTKHTHRDVQQLLIQTDAARSQFWRQILALDCLVPVVC